MNLRQYLQSRLPQPAQLTRSRWARWFGHRLHDPNLWHFGRRSVARATGVGLCVAFVPVPIHMLIVIPLAIVGGFNLPVIIAAIWITNPITWVPLFYFAYRVGLMLTGGPVETVASLALDANWASLSHALAQIWAPLCLGSAICGLFAGVAGYFLIDVLWRLNVVHRWRLRARRRAAEKPD